MRDVQLLAMGDSHSLFFSGNPHKQLDLRHPDLLIPWAATHHIGAVTAYSLVENGTRTRARELTFQAVGAARGAGFRGTLLLSYGEPDIRCHLVRQAYALGFEAAVDVCVQRYTRFIREVRELYSQVAVWAPIATQPLARHDEARLNFKDYYAVGSEIDRNFCTMLFARRLRESLEPEGVPVFDVCEQMIGRDGLTNPEYFFDGVHLSQKFMPYVMRLIGRRLNLTPHNSTPTADFREHVLGEFVFGADALRRTEREFGARLSHVSAIRAVEITPTVSQQAGRITLETDDHPIAAAPCVLAENAYFVAHFPMRFSCDGFSRDIRIRFEHAVAQPGKLTIFGLDSFLTTSFAADAPIDAIMRAASERPPSFAMRSPTQSSRANVLGISQDDARGHAPAAR